MSDFELGVRAGFTAGALVWMVVALRETPGSPRCRDGFLVAGIFALLAMAWG